VVGADVNSEAIADARSNAEANGGGGARFVCGDLDRLVEEEGALGLGGRGGGVGVVVVDPARAGMGRPVVEFLRRSGAARVVYVSCNAATQARDVARLAGAYALRSVVPVDLFPQTEHVETVAFLERVGG
jgi:23S rRNA (uracil1939-C5)-methyltransferase